MIKKIGKKALFLITVVAWLAAVILLSLLGNCIIEKYNLNEYLTFLNADMKGIWGYQITILGVSMTIFLYFLIM